MVNNAYEIIILLKPLIDFKRGFDVKETLPFTVSAVYDLNRSRRLKYPYGVSGQKVICCGPCKSGPVTKISFSIY